MDAHQKPHSSPKAIITSLLHHIEIVRQMTRREIELRYKGSIFGLLWSFINPIIMLAVYTFVFSVVFKTRWGTGSDSKIEFALALFAGLILHGFLAECINRAPHQILTNQTYVKKVVFPLEILSWVTIFSTLFHVGISLVVWLIFYVLGYQTLNLTILTLPLVLLPLVLYGLGLSWLLASLGVYIRDISQITGILTTLLLFLSPIFYPITALPEKFQAVLYLNPLTFIIEQARAVMMWGQFPDWRGLLISTVCAGMVAWLGFAFFQKTRTGFSDVL